MSIRSFQTLKASLCACVYWWRWKTHLPFPKRKPRRWKLPAGPTKLDGEPYPLDRKVGRLVVVPNFDGNLFHSQCEFASIFDSSSDRQVADDSKSDYKDDFRWLGYSIKNIWFIFHFIFLNLLVRNMTSLLSSLNHRSSIWSVANISYNNFLTEKT